MVDWIKDYNMTLDEYMVVNKRAQHRANLDDGVGALPW